ncbi:MAG TPA: hypothetical protein DCQ98_05465 [Planctomycetaceae bacterium]|nr:hypothetical protein [Planctomycetaceae bacterium]HRE99512.1 hypothetical protein [Pirellulaceae bacterium]
MTRPNRRLVLAALLAASLVTFEPLTAKLPLAAATVVKYQLQYWDIPGRTGPIYVENINDAGQIVGYYKPTPTADARGFLYDPRLSTTQAFDFEALIGGAGLPPGWSLSVARDINNHGMILGQMSSTDPVTGKSLVWPFLLDTTAEDLQIAPLVLPEQITFCKAYAINDNGDTLCTYLDPEASKFRNIFFNPFVHETPILLDPEVLSYHLSNPTDGSPAMVGGMMGGSYPLGTTAYWAVPELGVQTYTTMAAFTSVSDMNDAGHFCGVYANRPMRMITLPPTTFAYGTVARAINNADDVVIEGGYVYRNETGLTLLKNLLSGSRTDLSTWGKATRTKCNLLTERQANTNHARIGGTQEFVANGVTTIRPFLLTPIVVKR